ncbi:hypothetical protein SCLCIDRAFT_142630 [Scleroderma citrinum Foug A]|uniref:Uncharacterized protein n=1 Tax=Scleroderma citrinum Foug A TaxID=1036808 RepID=A0A0C2ZFU2_9AGAM|nr:hypothetical protein SCLCIDRAFT_142630 [Scleroderma citrinum Foug A]
MLAFDGSKLSPAPGHLYVRQQHAIIQLVEGPPPSPRDITSVVQSSASAHSSYPSTSDSEEDCTSYCSSVMTPDESTNDYAPVPYDNSFYSRMKRVYEWRNGFMPAADTYVLPSSPHKRKLDSYQAEYDDGFSHVSKRSSTRDPSRLNGYLCSACDAPFPTRQSLAHHGRVPQASEACRIAVEYNLE